MSDDFFDEAKVLEKFGVMPNQIKELLALVGDKADNILALLKLDQKRQQNGLMNLGQLIL